MNSFYSLAMLVAVASTTHGNRNGGGWGQQAPVAVNYQPSNSRQSYGGGSQQQSYSMPLAPVVQSYTPQKQSYSAPQQQSYSAPQKQSYSAPQQQSYSSSSPSYQQKQPEPVRAAYSTAPSSSYGSSSPASSSYESSNAAPSSYESASPSSSSSSYGSSGASPSYNQQSSSSYSAPAAPQTISISSSSSSYGSSSPSSYGSSSGSADANAAILRHNQNITPGQSYQFDYATSNGIQHSELTTVGAPTTPGGWGSITKTGQYSYTSPEGQPISLSYSADEGGFKAKGAHLPVPVKDINQQASAGGYSAGAPASGGYSSSAPSSGGYSSSSSSY